VDTPAAGRVAVMSIHPRYAEAILSGQKRVEFRKRRLAPDVTTVLVYATQPVGVLVGAFEITGYDTGSPTAIWRRHSRHGGITRRAFRDYYRGTERAVGILLRDARPLARPLALTDLDAALRPPQSFLYVNLAPWPSAGVPGQPSNHRARAAVRPAGMKMA